MLWLWRFAFFFIVFGLSHVVKEYKFCGLDQGMAFVYIYVFPCVCYWGISIANYILYSSSRKSFGLSSDLIISYVISGVILGISLLAAGVATNLFKVSFTTAFQILCFGRCLVVDFKRSNEQP